MRKFLTLFSAILLTVSMWGATWSFDSYVKSDFTITDKSFTWGEETYYVYEVTFTQYAAEWSTDSGTGKPGSGSGDVVLTIYPESASIAGTFTYSDGTLEGSVKKGARVCQEGSTITFTYNGGYSYTISGQLLTKNGITYYNYYFDATDSRNTVNLDPYKAEPQKNASGIEFESSEISYYYGVLTLGDEYQYYDSYLNLEFASAGDNIAAGTYSIGTDITPGDGTTSYYGTPNHSGYYDYDNYDTYFIVGGSVTISYLQDNKKMTISGTAISGHGTEITISVTGDNPFYVNPTYSREVTVGNYGTICLPRKFTEMTGVDGLFVPSYQDGGVLYCDEVALEDVQAGYAYIFKSNADEVTFTFNPEDVETAPIEANYMYGWLADDYELSVLDLYYDYEGYALLANNQIITPTTGSVIKKNRAMINLANVPSEATQLAPNRRRVAFGTNVATGLEKAQGNMRTGKMMIKGNLILMKNGKKFNAQGAEL